MIKTCNYKFLMEEQQEQLRVLESMPDEQIDLSNIPEKLDWSNAKRGEFVQ